MFDTGVGTCRGLSRWHIDGDQALASAEIESSHSPWRPPPPPVARRAPVCAAWWSRAQTRRADHTV